jgi:hypothetical protein
MIIMRNSSYCERCDKVWALSDPRHILCRTNELIGVTVEQQLELNEKYNDKNRKQDI